jgi:hypothetical protein
VKTNANNERRHSMITALKKVQQNRTICKKPSRTKNKIWWSQTVNYKQFKIRNHRNKFYDENRKIPWNITNSKIKIEQNTNTSITTKRCNAFERYSTKVVLGKFYRLVVHGPITLYPNNILRDSVNKVTSDPLPGDINSNLKRCN